MDNGLSDELVDVGDDDELDHLQELSRRGSFDSEPDMNASEHNQD
jgi:hypothetical protein